MIRTDINEFPFDVRDRAVSYLLIDYKNRTEQDYGTVAEKEVLVKLLPTLHEDCKIYGVWHGRYRTDLFIIPIDAALKELSKHFASI